MLELFLNPWTLAAGGLLISSPIIIHLINRLRYKRVHWAAMEFLLKSQKRNQRKVILKQLLLLLLRIFIVLLMGFLLARFLGFDPDEAQTARPTLHVVVLDDTPSMGDHWRQDGEQTDAFAIAKKQLTESLSRSISEVNAQQDLVVYRLSELESPVSIEKFGSDQMNKLADALNTAKVSPVRTPLSRGIEAAQQLFATQAGVARTLHVISDFRTQDWTGPAQTDLKERFEDLKKSDVTVHLIDVANPQRAATSDAVLHHDNLAIVDLRPDTRVSARFAPVEFTVDVANYSNSEKKNVRVAVKLNGLERPEGSVNIASLPPNQVTSARFTVAPDRLEDEQNPLNRFNLISANLEPEETGLTIDDVRYAYVEVREQVPVLIIEGDSSKRISSESVQNADGYYLEKLFREALTGYRVEIGSVDDLRRANLQQYSSIFICNVRQLDEREQANLTDYVRNGGGVAFFMGPNVRAREYARLYADGEGIFPVPLADDPTDPLTDQQKLGRLFSFQMQMYPRQKDHPALERLYFDTRGERVDEDEYNKFLRFVVIKQYWPVQRLRWDKETSRSVELITLPNHNPMGDYEPAVAERLARLPINDSEHSDFQKSLISHRDRIRRVAASTQPLHELAGAIEMMLNDPGSPNDPDRPNLKEFWSKPGMTSLKREFEELLETVRYGDPLYVSKSFGSGRVLAFLTSANNEWNDLDGPGKAYWPPLVIEMQKFLASAGTDVNRTVGSPTELTFDRNSYEADVKAAFMSETESVPGAGQSDSPSFIAPTGNLVMSADDEEYRLRVEKNREPGVYLYTLLSKPGPDAGPPGSSGSEPRPEYKAVTFNVDAAIEGDLRRVNREDLLEVATGAEFHTAEEDWDVVLNPQQSDYSELPWIFLIILMVLIAETALAVHLSYHTSGSGSA